MRQKFITNTLDFLLQNAIVLLQNATAITKCDDFITKCDSYYKLRQCKRQGCYQIETSQLICRANQLTCFYMMATLAFNELRIHWRLSMILKTSDKSEWSNVFRCVSVYIFWKFIQYSIHWDKVKMLEKIPSEKINIAKLIFFLRN